MVVGASCYLTAQSRWLEDRRRKVLLRLADIDPDDAELPHVMRHVLRLYDSDNSGSFSYDELVTLLRAVYPDLGTRQLSSMMDAVGWREDLEVEVTPDELQKHLVAWRDLLSNPEVSYRDSKAFRFKRTSTHGMEILPSAGLRHSVAIYPGSGRRSTAVPMTTVMATGCDVVSSTGASARSAGFEHAAVPPPPPAEGLEMAAPVHGGAPHESASPESTGRRGSYKGNPPSSFAATKLYGSSRGSFSRLAEETAGVPGEVSLGQLRNSMKDVGW